MIWFDLDNSPHVPLFRYVFKALSSRKVPFVITSRDFAQTNELLDLWQIPYIPVGKHGGKNKVNKVVNLFIRSQQLLKQVKNYKIELAVSHGSRTQLLAAKRLKVPSLLMLDYEYTESKIFNTLATKLLMPVFMPADRLKKAGFNLNKVIRYNGFKEQLYIDKFDFKDDIRKELNIPVEKYFVVIRPPSLLGNYHDQKSEKLLIAMLRFLLAQDTICLVVNRTQTEKDLILSHFSANKKLRFLSASVDGLQLLYAADLVVSGGGTMNRESALLGTKTLSIFTGRRPFLDEYLQSQGRLQFIEEPEQIKKIKLSRQYRKRILRSPSNDLASEVVDIILHQIE